MNIYDFDNTIFKGDSSVKFIIYSLLHHPLMVIKCLFKALFAILKGKSLGDVKSVMFSFVKNINNLDDYVNKFVLKNQKNIKKFYLEKRQDSDVIISATFFFIVKPFCNKLGLKNVIATKYDTKNGCIIGKNCKGEEKVKEFKKIYGDSVVKEAYSDSLSDIPIFNLAKKAYLVKGEKLTIYQKD